MSVFEVLALVWMLVLTIGLVYFAIAHGQMQRQATEVDLSDQLHYIQRQLTMDKIRRDDQLNAALKAAIRVFEDNKHIAEKYWGEFQALKTFMQE